MLLGGEVKAVALRRSSTVCIGMPLIRLKTSGVEVVYTRLSVVTTEGVRTSPNQPGISRYLCGPTRSDGLNGKQGEIREADR